MNTPAPSATDSAQRQLYLLALLEREFFGSTTPAPQPTDSIARLMFHLVENRRVYYGTQGDSAALTASDITDASSAGRNMLTATDQAAQRALVGGVVASQTGGNFSKSDATVANVPGVVATLGVGKHTIRGWVRATPDAIGGYRFAFNGTCTVSSMSVLVRRNSSTGNTTGIGEITALAGEVTAASAAIVFFFDGEVEISVAGTFQLQFAQNNASGSSVLNRTFFQFDQVFT